MPTTTMSASAMESAAASAVESAATAAVESAATAAVESATTTAVEAATPTRLEVAAAAKPATPTAKSASALRSEAPAVREPSAIEAPAVEAPPIESATIKSPIIVTTPIEAAPEAPAVPGSDSDEQAIHEVIRSPIAVRGASVRRVIIESIRARRRAVAITTVTAYSNSHRNLCVRIARRKHTNR
jgi:hypothetical protein